MLGDATQFIGAMLILAAAVGYLTLYFRRSVKGGGGCCGGGCDSLAKKNAEDAAKVESRRQFIPSENLADLARRRRDEAARSNGKSGAS